MTAIATSVSSRTVPRLVAMAGPPNCGKSTLFNRLTGLRTKIGNYPGVTVEQKRGWLKLNSTALIELVDLPGITSMNARMEDEKVTVDVLHGRMNGMRRPDSVLLVLDATALDKHLALAAPIISLGMPVIVALNFADELHDRGGTVEPEALQARLGVPVTLISARTGEGVSQLQGLLEATPEAPPQRVVELPVLNNITNCRRWAAETAETASFRRPSPPAWTRKLDSIVLHRIWGPLILLAVILAVFQLIPAISQPAQQWINDGVTAAAGALSRLLPESPARALLLEGILSGVGAVLAFLPQILVLFLFLGLLEDSGYMPRAAVIADRTMARFGLQGRSFIPLLSGYGCAIPAIMATRSIAGKRDRLATILAIPFMTCSARLPVYTLIISAFVPARAGFQTMAMIGLYLLGMAGAMGTALLFRATAKKELSHFIMEMPPYRWPSPRFLALQMLDRARVFLKKAGTIILSACVILWLLAKLPMHNGQFSPIEHSFAGMAGKAMAPLLAPLGLNWQVGVGLLTSLIARESIVSTLGTLYGMEGAAPGQLQNALHHDITTGGAVALVIFFAFALQCFSTMTVTRKETGSWKYPIAQFFYMGTLAYFAAWGAKAITDAAHL